MLCFTPRKSKAVFQLHNVFSDSIASRELLKLKIQKVLFFSNIDYYIYITKNKVSSIKFFCFIFFFFLFFDFSLFTSFSVVG